MNRRCVRRNSLARVRNERQRSVLYLHEIERVLGDELVFRGDRGDLVSDESHFGIQNRHVRRDVSGRHVERRDDRMNSGEFTGGSRVHGQDCRVRMRTAEYLADQHSGKLHVPRRT